MAFRYNGQQIDHSCQSRYEIHCLEPDTQSVANIPDNFLLRLSTLAHSAKATFQRMNLKMQNDHYVAKTYLKHFAGPSGLLNAYRKSDGRSFPRHPKGICSEPNGDMIPDFLAEPGYLGDYRAAFETLWDSGIAALKAHSLNMCDKLHIAGYWAQLMICTPTWTRIGIKKSNHCAINILSALNTISDQNGTQNGTLSAAIEDVERGEITVHTEANFVRATSAQDVLKLTWALYNADWNVYQNNTGTEYITSDNPASFEDQGDTWEPAENIPFIRYLPVTPRLCLTCDLARSPENFMNTAQDFSKEPKGTIQGGFVDLETVQRINICTAKCAEDLVLSSVENEYARDLSIRYSRFRVETESKVDMKLMSVASRTRCLERNA